MTKKELLEKIKDYSDDMEIVIWGIINENNPLEDVTEIELKSKRGKSKKVIQVS